METSAADKLPHHDCIIQSLHFIILVSWTVEKDRVFRTVLSKETRFRDILPILKYKLKNFWGTEF